MAEILNETNEQKEALIPVYYGNETVYLREPEIMYLTQTLLVDMKDLGSAVNNETDINKKICILFAISKRDDAWGVLEEAVKDEEIAAQIDFNVITNCPFFVLSRDHVDVFKYMHENDIIDDETYAYFNVISGQFFDSKFWEKKFSDCKSVSEMLQLVYDSFNGVDPYEVGMIELSDDVRDMIMSSIADDEVIDQYLIGPKSSIEFTSEDIIKFIKGHNISEETLKYAIAMIYQRGRVKSDEETVIDEVWGMFVSAEIDSAVLAEINYDSLPFLTSMIDGVKNCHAMYDFAMTGIILSNAFMIYPYLVLHKCEETFGPMYVSEYLRVLDLRNVLNAKNLTNVYFYKRIEFINTSMFEISAVTKCPVIAIRSIASAKKLSKNDDRLYVDGVVYDAEEGLKKLDWVNSFVHDKSILNEKLRDKLESDEQYAETAYDIKGTILDKFE